MAVTLTEKASKQVKKLMAEQSQPVFLRMGVKGGGCSGLSYALEFDTEVGKGAGHQIASLRFITVQ